MLILSEFSLSYLFALELGGITMSPKHCYFLSLIFNALQILCYNKVKEYYKTHNLFTFVHQLHAQFFQRVLEDC